MNRHNLPLAWHAATDMSAIGWVMIAYSSNCLISEEWLASIAEGDSITNVTLLYQYNAYFIMHRCHDYNLACNRYFSSVDNIVTVFNPADLH